MVAWVERKVSGVEVAEKIVFFDSLVSPLVPVIVGDLGDSGGSGSCGDDITSLAVM